MLVTESVYSTSEPALTRTGFADLTMCSAMPRTSIGTRTVPVQRVACGQVASPPPLAVAELLPLIALWPTVTFKVNDVLAVGARVPVKVQLSVVVPLQLQLVPVALTKPIPVASVSVRGMLPLVTISPVL